MAIVKNLKHYKTKHYRARNKKSVIFSPFFLLFAYINMKVQPLRKCSIKTHLRDDEKSKKAE